jgi:hypothetical protein
MPSIPFPHRSAVHYRFMILFIISHFQGVIKIFFKHIPLPPQILPLGNGDEGAKKEKTPTPVKAGGGFRGQKSNH